jgi:cytochrome c5
VRLRVTDPTGAVFSQVFELVLDAGLNAVYRLPANTNVRLELLKADGTPYGSTVLLEEVPGVPLASNIVGTGAPIPAGQSLWPPEPYETCKLVILREANAPTANSFLAFKGAGSLAQAEGYYSAVDPLNERTTLGAWWSKNGFVFDADNIPTNAVRTSYLNFNDLGSGRDMYFLQRPDGTVAAYVTNYGLFNQDHGNADLAANRDTPGATVCMEYGPVEGPDPTHIVKFFVYAGGDFAFNAPRAPAADLDGFGAKFVPNLCLNCHGGNYVPGAPNMGASFRELDIATYKFPGGRLTANAVEKTAFRAQNLIVKGLAATDTLAIQPIKDLIAGWYPGASTEQDNTFTPSGWAGAPQQGLYHDVVKQSCRTCHVAFDADTSGSGIGWISYDQLRLRRGGGLLQSFALCESRFMPHAVTTYRNFWLSGSPHQPAALRNFTNATVGAEWAAIGPCLP